MDILASMRTEIIKLPIGFIRVVELPLVILTFATTSGYESCLKYSSTKCSGGDHDICWSYPFALADTMVRSNVCDPQQTKLIDIWSQNFVSQSQFFVFTGVISFLYILGILGVYLLAWDRYEKDARFASYDFMVTAIFVVFWFAGSCAWANGVSKVKYFTGEEHMTEALTELAACKGSPSPCSIVQHGTYAGLNVSLILGFTMCGLFFANLWFIYKETHWWKSQHPEAFAADGGAPVAGQTSGIGATPTAAANQYTEYEGYGH